MRTYSFFKLSIKLAIASILLLGIVVISDVFIHKNQAGFYALTILIFLVLIAVARLTHNVYRYFTDIHLYLSNSGQNKAVYAQLSKLLKIATFAAVLITLISCTFIFAALQRIIRGFPLLG